MVRRAEPEVVFPSAHGAHRRRQLPEIRSGVRAHQSVPHRGHRYAARRPRAHHRHPQIHRAGFCGWPYAREGTCKTEEDPLDPKPLESFTKTLAAIRYLEDKVRSTTPIEVLALRYGMFYGPGTAIGKGGTILKMTRKRRFPIMGGGAGVWSFIHLLDAARATLAAMSHGGPGVFNIVDDEPAKVATWLPALAKAIDAKPPYRIPYWLGEIIIGKAGMPMMTQVRGGSNAKAKRELKWTPIYPSWRIGFVDGLE